MTANINPYCGPLRKYLPIFVTIITTTLLGCWATTNTTERELAFKHQGNNPTYIIEKIKTFEKTLFFTPEGKRTQDSSNRIGYFLKTDHLIPIPFISSKQDMLFTPFGSESWWIGLEIAPLLYPSFSYLPGLSPEKVIVFSDKLKLEYKFDSKSTFFYFIKNQNKIYYKDKTQGYVRCISACTDNKLIDREATNEESTAFTKATNANITFDDAICMPSLNDLEKLITHDKVISFNNTEPLFSDNTYTVDLHSEIDIRYLVITKLLTGQQSTIMLDDGIELKFQTTIINKNIYFYKGIAEHGVFNTKLINIPLDNIF